MELMRAGSRPSAIGPANWSTGTVRIDPVFDAHIAIQEQLDGKAVDWMEKVSDEQYTAGTDAS